MKNQYVFWYDEDLGCYHIRVYCDGWLVEKVNLNANEGNNYINRPQKRGYEVAFLPEDIEAARIEYEYMLEHRLAKKEIR